MDWRFVDSHTLEEFNTGYTIKLLGGTWYNPKEIKPIPPAGMAFLRQAQLLRCGMDYVGELCSLDKETGTAAIVG